MTISIETDLFARAKKGDAEAFERSVSPHLPMLLAYSRTIVGDYHVAQDVVQQTLLVAYRKLAHLDEEADFRGWLRAIAHREALNAKKRRMQAASRCALILEKAADSLYRDPSPPESSVSGRALSKCLNLLGERTSSVVRLHYFEGKRLEEVSQAVGMTFNAAKQLLYRVRLALRDCVQRRIKSKSVL